MPTTFANTIDGNEILAKRSQCDYAGNDLQTTYSTKSEVTTGLAAKEDSANKSQTLDPTSSTEFPSSSATASYVNSSVATATANFLGNFTLTELGLTYPATDAQIGAALDSHTWPAGVTPTNNDYTYIEIQNPQTTGIDDSVERFKFNGSNWLYEYTLNNSSFTAAEKAAIDSGINSTKVTAYDAHVADSVIHVTSSDKSTWNAKQDAISDLATIRSGASAGATAVQPGDLATVATTGAYSDLSGTPTIPTATSDLTNDSGFITLSDVPAQVQADWNEADSSDPSYIQNKPSIPAALSAGNGIDITSNVVSVDLDGASLTNGANGLSVTLPVPTTTGASQGDVLSVGQSGIEWATPSSGGGNVFMATSTTTFPELWQAYHVESKIVYCEDGSGNPPGPTPYFLQSLKADDSSYTTGVASFVQFNRYTTGRIEAYYAEVSFNVNHPTLGTVNFTRQIIVPDNPQSHVGEFLTAHSGGGMVFASVNQVPASTSSDADKVLTVDAQGVPGWASAQAPISAGDGIDITSNVVSAKVDGTTIDTNASGELTVIGGGGGGTQADWTEDDPTDPSYIENKPTPKTLTAGAGISITENSSTITVAATGSAGVTDVEVNGTSVVSGGVASISVPTVDQTYSSSSTNAQSGTAVADAIGNLPTNLSAAQLLALKQALGCDETVIMNTPQTSSTAQMTVSEPFSNFEYIKVYAYWNYNSTQRIQAFNEFLGTQTTFNICALGNANRATGTYASYFVSLDCTISGTTITVNKALRAQGDLSNPSESDSLLVQRIVGIRRIASNTPASPEPDPEYEEELG